MKISIPPFRFQLPRKHLCYLATPYSKFPDGIEAAFQAACLVDGALLKLGICAYSPIAHTHPIAQYGEIDPLDHNIWLPFDEAMMRAADAIIVAQLPGWDVSFGVAHEIEFFKNAGKLRFDMPCEYES